MSHSLFQFLFLLDIIAFLMVVFMHIVRKNTSFIFLYGLQSAVLTIFLVILAIDKASLELFFIAAVTCLVKVVLAPWFFYRVIARNRLHLSTASAYLNIPLTLIVLVVLSLIAYSDSLNVVWHYLPSAVASVVPLNITVILASFFLVINRKGALSQIIGILSLENGIVFLSSFLGLEQSFALELGVIFDIFVWIIIAAVFVSMVYRQFESISITKMKHLIEE
ncbi:MAG TPA: hypothetical protein VJB65_03535 [Patescibacteria group bacterium]|nr:hypothetical protein [Patescibacteria group bacterium]